jgi:hypothetical protein
MRVNQLKDDPNYGKTWTIVTDDSYTHAILLNTAMPPLHIDKSHVLGLAFEPNQYLHIDQKFIDYATEKIGTYLIGDTKHLSPPFTEHYSYLHHTKPNYNAPHRKIMSLMVSKKTQAPGHIYRHALAHRILQTKLPVDIYGNGCHYHRQDARIKGPYDDNTLYNDYVYHVCVENFQLNGYFSEKITNPLLCGTVPVYLGCPKIQDYFPDNVILLTGNIDDDMKIIVRLCGAAVVSHRIDIKQVEDTINIKHELYRRFKIPFYQHSASADNTTTCI